MRVQRTTESCQEIRYYRRCSSIKLAELKTCVFQVFSTSHKTSHKQTSTSVVVLLPLLLAAAPSLVEITIFLVSFQSCVGKERQVFKLSRLISLLLTDLVSHRTVISTYINLPLFRLYFKAFTLVIYFVFKFFFRFFLRYCKVTLRSKSDPFPVSTCSCISDLARYKLHTKKIQAALLRLSSRGMKVSSHEPIP